MHELLLLRHAKTEYSSQSGQDFDRELRRRGHNDSRLVADWLKHRNLIPDAVVSSTARRAQQTADIVCQEIGFSHHQIIWEQGIYEASPAEILRIVENHLHHSRVLLVGHNPGFEMLARILAVEADFRNLPTAGLAHLSWSEGTTVLEPHSAQLMGFFRPSDVRGQRSSD